MILPENSEALAFHKELLELNLIWSEDRLIVKCIDTQDKDYPALSTDEKRCTGWLFVDDFIDERVRCLSCGRMLSLSDKTNTSKAKIVHLLVDNIGKFVMHEIEQYVDFCEKLPSGTAWRIHKHNKIAILALLEYMPLSVSYQYLQSDTHGLLGLALNNQFYEQMRSRYTVWPITSLWNLIHKPQEVIDLLDTVFLEKIDRLKIQQCKSRLMKHASKFNRTGSEFENFCLNIEKEIFSDLSRTKTFLGHLEIHKLLAQRPIHLGGPGKPDLVRLPLFEYFKDFLMNCTSIESKQYIQTRLSISDVGKAFLHAKRYNQEKVVIYTLDENIPPSIWDDVIRVRAPDGSFVYLIIDAEFISFLISSLGVDSVLT